MTIKNFLQSLTRCNPIWLGICLRSVQFNCPALQYARLAGMLAWFAGDIEHAEDPCAERVFAPMMHRHKEPVVEALFDY